MQILESRTHSGWIWKSERFWSLTNLTDSMALDKISRRTHRLRTLLAWTQCSQSDTVAIRTVSGRRNGRAIRSTLSHTIRAPSSTQFYSVLLSSVRPYRALLQSNTISQQFSTFPTRKSLLNSSSSQSRRTAIGGSVRATRNHSELQSRFSTTFNANESAFWSLVLKNRI